MSGHIVTSVVFALAGGLLLLFGFLIKYRGMTQLIAGYSADRVTDEQGLARCVGGRLLLMGAIGIGSGALMAVLPDALLMISLMFSIAVFAACLDLAIRSGRYMR